MHPSSAPEPADATPATPPTPAAEPLPPADPGEPDWARVPAERPVPRGCHPLVFGVVMGTIQFALTLWLWKC